MIESIIKWSVATVACAGVVIYLWNKHKNKVLTKLPLDISGKEENETGPSERGTVSFPKKSFVDNARKFTGSFEPLYNAVHNLDVSLEDKTNIYEDWSLRLKTICDDTVYAQWTKKMSLLQLSDRLAWLLQEIDSCGMVRDNRTVLVIDEDTVSHYADWNGAPIAIGDEVKVASAAWLLNGVCIEKGIIITNNTTL